MSVLEQLPRRSRTRAWVAIAAPSARTSSTWRRAHTGTDLALGAWQLLMNRSFETKETQMKNEVMSLLLQAEMDLDDVRELTEEELNTVSGGIGSAGRAGG